MLPVARIARAARQIFSEFSGAAPVVAADFQARGKRLTTGRPTTCQPLQRSPKDTMFRRLRSRLAMGATAALLATTVAAGAALAASPTLDFDMQVSAGAKTCLPNA